MTKNTKENMNVRMLTKAEACRELKLSLSTLNRRIASGEVSATRESRGRRHRVYVMLDDEPPADNGHVAETAEPVLVQHQIRSLEERIALLEGHLAQERRRNVELEKELKANQARRGPWWRFWQRYGDRRALYRAGRTWDDG